MSSWKEDHLAGHRATRIPRTRASSTACTSPFQWKTASFSRRAGLHFFNPAVDPDLVDFLYGLPSALLNLDGRGKGLAWESVRRRIGKDTASALGFADLDPYFDDLIRSEGARALEQIDGVQRLSSSESSTGVRSSERSMGAGWARSSLVITPGKRSRPKHACGRVSL